jgi:hypothetical protein
MKKLFSVATVMTVLTACQTTTSGSSYEDKLDVNEWFSHLQWMLSDRAYCLVPALISLQPILAVRVVLHIYTTPRPLMAHARPTFR